MRASSIIYGFLARVLGSVLIVALLIYLSLPAKAVFGDAISGLGRLNDFKTLLDSANKKIESQFKAGEERVIQLRGKPKGKLDNRISEIDKELAALERRPHVQGGSYFEIARLLQQGQLEEALGNDVQKSVLKQERQALSHLLVSIQDYADPRARHQRIEDARLNAVLKKQAEDTAKIKVNELNERTMCRVPFTACSTELIEATKAQKIANRQAWDAYYEFKRVSEVNATANATIKIVNGFDRSDVRAKLAALQMEISGIEGLHLYSFRSVIDALHTASLIVAGALVAGLLLKAFLYFFLAPLAARCVPMVVRPSEDASNAADGGQSSLSVILEMTPDQELVVVGSFLQSVSDEAKTRSKLFFSNRHPLTSFLSGLWMMTRLRVKSASRVVLSATTDPLQELNLVRLKSSESLVIFPRHLAAVIHIAKRQPRLRGAWKFGVHAFLTLQFRYLAISGPCTLVVAGCRGVRVECAKDGRLISQAMTVGFSANLAYSVVRTETFIPYLLGQRPLFNDRFKGGGVVLYQEVPASAEQGGFTGRGLQGVLDGLMKAFGI